MMAWYGLLTSAICMVTSTWLLSWAFPSKGGIRGVVQRIARMPRPLTHCCALSCSSVYYLEAELPFIPAQLWVTVSGTYFYTVGNEDVLWPSALTRYVLSISHARTRISVYTAPGESFSVQ